MHISDVGTDEDHVGRLLLSATLSHPLFFLYRQIPISITVIEFHVISKPKDFLPGRRFQAILAIKRYRTLSLISEQNV